MGNRNFNIRDALTITADGRTRLAQQIVFNPNTAVMSITLGDYNGIRSGQSVVVTYTDPSTMDDDLVLEDLAGNDAASFATGSGTAPAVVNGSSFTDTTPPVFSTAAVSETGEVLTVDVADIPALPDDAAERATFLETLAGAFAVTANGAPVSFTIDPASDVLRGDLSFDLARPIGMGQTVSVTYTKPTSGTVFLEDESGNRAESFSRNATDHATIFFNDSTVDTAPWLVSATVNAAGTQLDLVFDQAFAAPTSYTTLAGRFAVSAGGASVSFSLPAASQVPASGRLVLSLSTAIERDQVVVVTYTDPTTGDDSDVIEDAAGNEAATFTTGQGGVVAVTNNSNNQDDTEDGPVIRGRIAVGETLTADTSTITDSDGTSGATYTYGWARVDTEGTPTDISVATGSTYEIVSADAGNRLRLTVSFTDDASNPETRSVTTSYVPHQDRVLVSNFLRPSVFAEVTFETGLVQGFTVGTAGNKYRVSSKQWDVNSVTGTDEGDSQGGLFDIHENGTLKSQIATFYGTLTQGTPTFHAPTHALLDGGEPYGITLWGGTQRFRFGYYTNSLGWGHKVWRKVARGMFYPVPGRQRPYTTRIRTQFTQIRLNRRHLLLDAPIHLPFNPSTDLLEHPLDRVQLRTVSRLDDRRKAYIPHLLATVSTRPIPYQRFHVRVMLQLLDRHSYIIGPHRVDPPPCQPPPPNV